MPDHDVDGAGRPYADNSFDLTMFEAPTTQNGTSLETWGQTGVQAAPNEFAPTHEFAPVCEFDYSSLPPNVAEQLRKLATRIRRRSDDLRQTIIDMGVALSTAKKHLKRGQFVDWVRLELGLDPRLAQLWMRVAKFAAHNNEVVNKFTPSALYVLTAASTPVMVRDEVVAAARNGQGASAKAIKTLVSHSKVVAPSPDMALKQSAVASDELFLLLTEYLPAAHLRRIGELLPVIKLNDFHRIANELQQLKA